MQFSPGSEDSGTKGSVSAYDERFYTNFNFTETADSVKHGPYRHPDVDNNKNFSSNTIHIRAFSSSDTPSDEAVGLAYGQNVKAKITNYTLNIEPNTGLTVSRFLTSQASISIESSNYKSNWG